MESHLLQMRGLKLSFLSKMTEKVLSHLLQMRGLKQEGLPIQNQQKSRIFYRCVD